MLAAVRQAPADRAPHGRRALPATQRCGPLRDHRTTRPARLRQPLPSARVPADEARDDPADPLDHLLGPGPSRPLRLGRPQRRQERQPAAPAQARARPAQPGPGRRLLNLVWTEDEEFGLYLWTAFTTGARRGEVSALRENRFDFKSQQVRLARNYLVKQGQHIEKAPKDGEGRVLSLDLLTCELFQERFQRRRAEARALGVQVPEDAFAFSPDPVGREPWNPDTMTHRYRRYARRVGITSSLKELRHYSATQLLAAGTDLNTVAGRLGHAEGSTTLKFYAQFTRPADQAAATVIPSQLDGLRKKERLRELYQQHMPPSGADELAVLASVIGPQAGLDEATTLAWLTEFASAD